MKQSPFIIALIASVGLAAFAHAETAAAVKAAVAVEPAVPTDIHVKPPTPTSAPTPAPAPAATPAPIHGMVMEAPKDATPATKEFIATNSKMHGGMMIEFTGNTDVDFVRGMIPHHQGAVDMAETELKYGKDPEIKKFAQDIIKAQTAEIKFMNEWLAKHAK